MPEPKSPARRRRAASLPPLKVLGILAASAGEGLTLAEMRHRHGVGLRDLLALEHVLGSAAEAGAEGPALRLDIFRAPSGAARVQTLARSAKSLKALAGLPLGEAAMALGALERLTAPADIARPLARLAARLRRRVPASEREAAPLAEGTALTRVERAALAEAEEALRQGRELAFNYRGVSRHSDARRVRPLAISQAGGWRMAAWDLDRGAIRVFLLDRMLGASLGAPGALPGGAAEALRRLGPLERYRPSGAETPVTVKVRQAALEALLAKAPEARVARRADGWVWVELGSASPAWVTACLLPLIPQVAVEGPEPFRRDWRRALESLL